MHSVILVEILVEVQMLQAVSVILAHNVIGVAIRSDLKRITLLAWIFPWDMDISHFA